jgi:hypothetical protein
MQSIDPAVDRWLITRSPNRHYVRRKAFGMNRIKYIILLILGHEERAMTGTSQNPERFRMVAWFLFSHRLAIKTLPQTNQIRMCVARVRSRLIFMHGHGKEGEWMFTQG